MMPPWSIQWLRPTLVRRLMVAQVLLLTALWSVLMVIAVMDGSGSTGTLSRVLIYDAVISIADNLTAGPALQQQSLHAIERAIRAEFENGLVPELAPHLQVWQNGKLVYRTRGALPVIHGSGREGIATQHIDGARWLMRTRVAPGSGTRVEMLAPSEPWNFFLTLNSRGYYLLPLMISLPFLLLPAWLSIRLALRPWSRLAHEVAARGPHDLTPLVYKPTHLELVAMVDSVDALLLSVSKSAQRERSFIADAAHELRTPLAAMRVNVEALQARPCDPLQQELLAGIFNSADRATRLVGQLLLLMRNETTHPAPLELLAVDTLLQERLAALSWLAIPHGIELELKAINSVQVFGQRETFISLIDNLVDNAIKYSPPGGVVMVALVIERDGAVLTVSDQGPGIAPALRERVFDRFFRDPHQTQSGSGLGLPIAQSAAQQHGGTITLSGAAGGGLLASVWLPTARK